MNRSSLPCAYCAEEIRGMYVVCACCGKPCHEGSCVNQHEEECLLSRDIDDMAVYYDEQIRTAMVNG